MTRIVQISDLHFGAEYPDRVETLLQAIHKLEPRLVIISGDLTQHATESEFQKARDFLDKLQTKWIAVPGNHDVPSRLRDLPMRFMDPFSRYRTHIREDLDSYLEIDDVFIAALNTARRVIPHWNWANGAIGQHQIDKTEAMFKTVADSHWKILVCHHPLYRVPDAAMNTLVWGKGAFLHMIQDHPELIILTGHTHSGSLCNLENGTSLITAPSAFSHRLRTQDNGFNWLEFEEKKATIHQMMYDAGENAYLRSCSLIVER